tara:strand:+ start:311 stop:598 length:288 start_codon:yes stop_codon:yes gene_type:complete
MRIKYPKLSERIVLIKKTNTMTKAIKISEQQLSDLTKRLLTSDLIDIINHALQNEQGNDESTWYGNMSHDRKSAFFNKCKSRIEDSLDMCKIEIN